MSLSPKTSEMTDFSQPCMMPLNNYLMIKLSVTNNINMTILQLQRWQRHQVPGPETDYPHQIFLQTNSAIVITVSFHILSNSYTHTFYFLQLIPHPTVLKSYVI